MIADGGRPWVSRNQTWQLRVVFLATGLVDIGGKALQRLGGTNYVYTHRTHKLSSLMLVPVLALACAHQKSPEAGSKQATEQTAYDGTYSRFEHDRRIGRYTSSPWGFSTASYWIEGPDGVILVDLQFLPSAATELVEIAERETGKKVVLAIVLHANPDKFNGTATLQRRGVEVLTSDQVLALIPEVHEKRVKAFAERYRPDYPAALPEPASFGGQSRELEAAGLRLKLHTVGPGCGDAHVLLEFEGHLFTGDLVGSGVHSWLELGHTDAWLKRVDEMRALNPMYVHPGRGPSGGPELLANQRTYLETVIQTVSDYKPAGAPKREALREIKAKLRAKYPDYGFAVFLDIGLPAVWRQMAEAQNQPAAEES